MALLAWEIKNKFIYTLRHFSQAEIDELWKQFQLYSGSTDEHEFVDLLKYAIGERFDDPPEYRGNY